MLSKNSAKIINPMVPYRHQILQQLLKNKGNVNKQNTSIYRAPLQNHFVTVASNASSSFKF